LRCAFRSPLPGSEKAGIIQSAAEQRRVTYYHIYADESRQNAHEFMLYGMIVVPRGEIERVVTETITALRAAHKWGAEEIKWASVSNAKLGLYKSVLDAFFDQGEARFCCMRLRRASIDYEKDHGGDVESAFYWGYSMALSRILEPGNRYEIFIDALTDQRPNRVMDLRASINAQWIQRQLETGVFVEELVRDIKATDSKRFDLLQLADLIVGAVGYAVDGCHRLPAASPAKISLMEHISARVGCGSLDEHDGRGTRFHVWNFASDEDGVDNGTRAATDS
jgi:hypothetical protein